MHEYDQKYKLPFINLSLHNLAVKKAYEATEKPKDFTAAMATAKKYL